MLYINGTWCDSKSGDQIQVINPANGEVVDVAAKGGALDAEAAIDAAHQAFQKWSKQTANERYSYLMKAAEALHKRADEIAELVTREMGKPLAESRTELNLAIDYLRWYAEEGKRIYGDTIPASSSDKRILVLRQPVGVVAAITPWNFPLAMIARKVGPALAAGCTVVLKAASATPLSAIAILKAFDEAGLPAGVLNLVNGSASEVVGALMKSPLVRKVTFTGSTEVGKQLAKQAADTMKKTSMELGGHAPLLIFEDADLEQAAEGVIASKFRNAGQTCVCTNRVYVQKSVLDRFSGLLINKMRQLKVGNGLEEGIKIGPLIDEDALAKVMSQVEDAVNKGAVIGCGGRRLEDGELADGTFYEPTLLLHATHDMLIAREETFGPVMPLFAFDTEEEAIQRANDTEYGLAAYVYTNDLSRTIRVMEALDYGIV